MATSSVLILSLFVLSSPPDSESAVKTRTARPSAPRVQPIDRAKAEQHPRLQRQTRLSKDARVRLRAFTGRSGTPVVLLPAAGDLLQSAVVTTGPHWYAASMQRKGYSVYVTGNSAAIRVPSIEHKRKTHPRPVSKDLTPRISRTHDIVTVSLSAWGAAYDVDIECLGGIQHAVCGDDARILALVGTLQRFHPGSAQ